MTVLIGMSLLQAVYATGVGAARNHGIVCLIDWLGKSQKIYTEGTQRKAEVNMRRQDDLPQRSRGPRESGRDPSAGMRQRRRPQDDDAPRIVSWVSIFVGFGVTGEIVARKNSTAKILNSELVLHTRVFDVQREKVIEPSAAWRPRETLLCIRGRWWCCLCCLMGGSC